MADDFLDIMKVLPDPNAFMQGQQQAANLQQTQLQNQTGSFALQQAQQQAAAQQAQQQSYQSDVADFIQNPTAEGASNLTIKYPEQAKAISDGWNMRDKATNDADRQQLASVYSLLDNNRPDLATQLLTQRQQADQAAGKSEPLVDTLLQTIKTNPDHAKGIAAYMLSSIPGGEDFAKTLTAIGDGKDDGSTVVNAGGALVRKSDGTVLYKADSQPHYATLKNADGSESVVMIPGSGGSGAAPAGAVPTGSYQGGWTPYSDNPAASVNNKLAMVSKTLGVGVGDDVTKLGPMAVAQALTSGENVDPSHHNPAALMDPKTGKLMNFPSDAAGMAAAAALVARKFKNGQTTVQSLIVGKPTGGNPAAAPGAVPGVPGAVVVAKSGGGDQDVPGDVSKSGDAYAATLPPAMQPVVKAIVNGQMALPSSFALSKPYWQQVLAAAWHLDPTFDSSQQPARVAAVKQFTGNGKAAQIASSGNRLAYHLNDLWDASNQLSGPDVGWAPLSNLLTTGAQSFQQAKVAKYNAILPFVSGELQKLTKNGSATEGETKKIMQDLQPGQPTTARNAAIQEVVDLAQGQFHPFRDQWQSVFPNNPPPVDFTPTTQKIFDNITAGGHALQVDHNGNLVRGGGAAASGPVHVTSRAQALALPSGTKFIDPSGVLRVRP